MRNVTIKELDIRVPFARLNVGDTFIERLGNPNVMIRIQGVLNWNTVDFDGILYEFGNDDVIRVECDVTVEIV